MSASGIAAITYLVECATADQAVAVSKAKRGEFERAAQLLRRAGRQLAEAELALLEMARNAAIAPVLAKRRTP